MTSPSTPGYQWTTLLLIPLSTSCLVGDDTCGENQVKLREGNFGACICAEGTVPSADNKRCEPCEGEFVVAVNGSCRCIDGYSESDGVCVPVEDSGAPEEGGAPARLTGTSGQGDSCASASDCAAKDATFCMTLAPMPICLVEDCGVDGARSCASDRVCCDLSNLSGLLPSLGTANGLCIEASGCAMGGGTVVTP